MVQGRVKRAGTPLARSSVQIGSSGLIRIRDIKQQLFYGVNFCTEDFKKLILLGSLCAKWFFPGCCFILLRRPLCTECEPFVPNLTITLWRLELLHSLTQGILGVHSQSSMSSANSGIGPTPQNWSWRTETTGMSQRKSFVCLSLSETVCLALTSLWTLGPTLTLPLCTLLNLTSLSSST